MEESEGDQDDEGVEDELHYLCLMDPNWLQMDLWMSQWPVDLWMRQ